MYDNSPIEPDTLPGIKGISWNPLARAYMKEICIEHLIWIGVIAVGFGVFVTIAPANPNFWFVWIGLALLLALLLTHARFAVPKKGYAIREHDILFKTGLIFQRRTAIPFNRVQHAETSRGPLERYLGLASLKLFTAGGSSGDLTIPGLEFEAADRLRDFVLDRIGKEDDES